MLSPKLCVYSYKWHEITINEMKYKPVRIMYYMRNEKWYDMNEKR